MSLKIKSKHITVKEGKKTQKDEGLAIKNKYVRPIFVLFPEGNKMVLVSNIYIYIFKPLAIFLFEEVE